MPLSPLVVSLLQRPHQWTRSGVRERASDTRTPRAVDRESMGVSRRHRRPRQPRATRIRSEIRDGLGGARRRRRGRMWILSCSLFSVLCFPAPPSPAAGCLQRLAASLGVWTVCHCAAREGRIWISNRLGVGDGSRLGRRPRLAARARGVFAVTV